MKSRLEYYHVSASVDYTGGTAGSYQRISIFSAGNYLASGVGNSNVADHTVFVSSDLSLTAGQIVTIDQFLGGATLGSYTGGNYFFAHKLY